MSLNETSTGRNDSYKFNLTPKEVPKVNTKYRKIVTSIPPENSIPILNDLHKYEPESKYLKVASIGNNFPVTKNNSILEIKTLHTNYFSIVDFIKNNEKNNLTHIVTDNHNESKILKDLFLNDVKYPYLVKVYDSIEHGYKYHVKVYKINYNQFIEN